MCSIQQKNLLTILFYLSVHNSIILHFSGKFLGCFMKLLLVFPRESSFKGDPFLARYSRKCFSQKPLGCFTKFLYGGFVGDSGCFVKFLYGCFPWPSGRRVFFAQTQTSGSDSDMAACLFRGMCCSAAYIWSLRLYKHVNQWGNYGIPIGVMIVLHLPLVTL